MTTIICPSCSARYRVDEAKLAKAKQFRCKQCHALAPIQGQIVRETVDAESDLPEKITAPVHVPQPPPEDEFAEAEKMLARLETSEDIAAIFDDYFRRIGKQFPAYHLRNGSSYRCHRPDSNYTRSICHIFNNIWRVVFYIKGLQAMEKKGMTINIFF